MKKRLFVISVDSLFFEDLDWLRECPNFYRLYEQGAVVQKMKSTYPAMTYVAHSTMMTGCHEEKHGIYHNERVEPQMHHPRWHWHRSQLKTKTIFDAAKEAGYTTACVNWPVTGGDPSIDYLVPEIWADTAQEDVRPRFLSACSKPVVPLFDRYRNILNWDCIPELDDFGVACLKEILREYRPEVTFLHLSYLDRARHDHGTYSEEARHALKECDRKVGELFEILKSQGIFEKTDFFVMGDHGHLPVNRVVQLNTVLAREGLLDLDAEGHILDYRCYIHAAGLSAHVVLKDPEDVRTRRTVEELLKIWQEDEKYGCQQVFTKEQLKELHLVGPFEYAIESRPGTSFGGRCTGELVCDAQDPTQKLSVSAHGHLPDRGPQPIFFGAGPDIRSGVTVERGDLIDEAPTYGSVLGVSLPWAQGRAMKELLK